MPRGGLRGWNKQLATPSVVTNLGRGINEVSVPFLASQRAKVEQAKEVEDGLVSLDRLETVYYSGKQSLPNMGPLRKYVHVSVWVHTLDIQRFIVSPLFSSLPPRITNLHKYIINFPSEIAAAAAATSNDKWPLHSISPPLLHFHFSFPAAHLRHKYSPANPPPALRTRCPPISAVTPTCHCAMYCIRTYTRHKLGMMPPLKR